MKDEPLDISSFLKLILEALEASKVEYLIGGAIAEWAWGKPRATQDLDIVINLPVKAVSQFSRELKKGICLSPPTSSGHNDGGSRRYSVACDPYVQRPQSGLYLMREGDVFRKSAFQRRLLVDYGPPIGEVYVHSPEDLILYKLMYLGLSGQPKHARDIAAMG